MNRKIYVFIAALIVCASVLVAYAVARSSQSSASDGLPKPKTDAPEAATTRHLGGVPAVPPGMPLAASYSRLSTLAKRGDAAAASRLFDDVRVCLRVGYLQEVYEKLSKDRDWLKSDAYVVDADGRTSIETRSTRIAKVEEDIARVSGAQQLCEGIPDLNDGRIYSLALQAAADGDDDATGCLLQATYPPPPVTPADGAAYREQVMKYADDGLKRGSWAVAKGLGMIYGGNGVGGYSDYLIQQDPKKLLQVKMLIRHGVADGSPESVQLDRQITAIEEGLDDVGRRDASVWAEQTYKNYFFMSGPVAPYSGACNL